MIKLVCAPIAQGIEQKFPELCVEGSNPSRCNKKYKKEAKLLDFKGLGFLIRIQNY